MSGLSPIHEEEVVSITAAIATATAVAESDTNKM